MSDTSQFVKDACDRFKAAREADRQDRAARYREMQQYLDECPLWPQFRIGWVKARIRQRLGTYPPASRLPA